MPKNIVDHNIATDYGKLARLFHLQDAESNFKALEEIVSGADITLDLTEQFSFERPFSRRDFLSMLYYMGFLTIKGTDTGGVDLKVPNYVIWRLYIDFAAVRLDERAGLGWGRMGRAIRHARAGAAQRSRPALRKNGRNP